MFGDHILKDVKYAQISKKKFNFFNYIQFTSTIASLTIKNYPPPPSYFYFYFLNLYLMVEIYLLGIRLEYENNISWL